MDLEKQIKWANEKLEAAKHFLDVTPYMGDKGVMHLVDSRALGLDEAEVKLIKEHGLVNREVVDWLNAHPQGRQKPKKTGGVDIRDLMIETPYLVHLGCKTFKDDEGLPFKKRRKQDYKTDREALGKWHDKWYGWTIDIMNARAWKTNGKEASYSLDNGGYLKVNGQGLYRAVYMAYLVLRARTEPKYMKICKEFNSGEGNPYQVNHLWPKLISKRPMNSIGYLTLERVEKNKPNRHQVFNNIGKDVNKYLKKKNK